MADLDHCPRCGRQIRDFDATGVEYGTGQRVCRSHAFRTREHHPRCDDDGWDHWGPCIIETDLPADPDDPNWEATDVPH